MRISAGVFAAMALALGNGPLAADEGAASASVSASEAGNGIAAAFDKWRRGVMIDEGKAAGTPADAIALIREAAAARIPGAFASLGMMHATGRGVARDYEAAMRYYQAAARMGEAHGLEGIGVLYARGEGVPRDMNEALAYWLAAAAGGDSDATALLVEHMPASGDSASADIYARATRIADAFGVGEKAGTKSAAGF